MPDFAGPAPELESKEESMTQRTRKQLRELCVTRDRYAAVVEKRLAKRDSSLREALVESAAKYYPALKKLAKA